MRHSIYKVFFLFMLMSSAAAYGQTEIDDPEDDVNVELPSNAAERLELSARLDREPHAGMSKSELYDFYRDQCMTAQRLGRVDRELELLPKWLDAAGPDPELIRTPLWRLWRANMAGGDVSLGLKYGRDLLSMVSVSGHAYFRVRMLTALAKDQIDLMELAQAEDFLKQAQSGLQNAKRRNKQGASEFKQLHSEADILSVRSKLLSRRGKHADAERLAHQELAITEKALTVELGTDENFRKQASNHHARALEDVMQVQIAQGRLIDAAGVAQTLL